MSTKFLTPPELRGEMQLRVARVQDKLRSQGLEAALIGYNSNIYYLSSRYFRGYVYVPAEGEALFLPIRPVGLGGDNVAYVRKPEQIPDVLASRGLPLPATVGLEFDSLSYSEIERLKRVFPGAEVSNCSGVMSACRMVKTPYELQMMREDARHQTTAYRKFPKVFRPEMTDIEFQIEIEKILRMEGALGYYRTAGNLMELNMGTVLNGDNADSPTPYDFAVGGGGVDLALPAGADGRIMHNGTTVSIDMNGCFNGYQTDMTRSWRIGEVPEEAFKAHECSRRILRELEKMGKPGTLCCDLYNRAVEIAEEEKLEKYFMGHLQKAAFIGHGVGIELNEKPVLTPRSKEKLEENMTIAIEPKFVLPEIGPVGVENTYAVTAEGLEALTQFPEELINLMDN